MENQLTPHQEGYRIFTPLSGHYNWVRFLPLVVIGVNDPYRTSTDNKTRPNESLYVNSDTHKEGDVLFPTVYEKTWVDQLAHLSNLKKTVTDPIERHRIDEAQLALWKANKK